MARRRGPPLPRSPGALAAALGLLLGRGRTVYNASLQVEACRIYGNIDSFAYFYVDILVGTPPQRASVILDTGSGVTAFPCARCSHCGEHIDPAFNFSETSTARWVPCGADCHSSCKDEKCTYYQGYTEGSAIEGFWFEDMVSLGDAFQHNPPVLARVGCHSTENNLFYTQKASGILGMGPPVRYGLQSASLIQRLFQDSHVDGSVFTICLAEWGGQLNVGGSNDSYHTGPVQEIGLSVASGYSS
ncbi:unnamed protein product [Prorocentrum cordatum]|uniref:Peptidase A1 domain-containing protein n=1 Tax=Prorocentrum cordatum TaxID=2364126 RepID=A0ABN9SX65_9DINO|nr:unnamed protein product [Polarella glacialis]